MKKMKKITDTREKNRNMHIIEERIKKQRQILEKHIKHTQIKKLPKKKEKRNMTNKTK